MLGKPQIKLSENPNKTILWVIIFGFILRVVFHLFLAKFYFNRENIYVSGDTYSWVDCIVNLIDHGTYKISVDHDYSYFARMPGYSFFIGIFYLLFGKNFDLIFPAIAWTQILFDTAAIFLVYRICKWTFKDNYTPLIAAFLYATYPFIIVWTPVAYSESISIFFMLWSLYYFRSKSRYK